MKGKMDRMKGRKERKKRKEGAYLKSIDFFRIIGNKDFF